MSKSFLSYSNRADTTSSTPQPPRQRSKKNAKEILDFLRRSHNNDDAGVDYGNKSNDGTTTVISKDIEGLVCGEHSINSVGDGGDDDGDDDVDDANHLIDLERFIIDNHRSISLSNLDLSNSNNSLTSESTRLISSILNVQHESLLRLNLSHNPITSVGLRDLIAPVQSPLSSLISLDLTDTNLGSKSGEVIALLLRNDTSILQVLNLANNHLGTKGVKAIAPALASNSVLKSLNLSHNNIKARGATLLANALESSPKSNLQILNLTCNALGYQGMHATSKMLTTNRTIESLYAGMNNIAAVGAAHLSFAIKHNYTLRRLHINENQIGCDAISVLFDQLKDYNRTIEDLDIAWNDIGIQGATDLTQVLVKNSALKKINVSVCIEFRLMRTKTKIVLLYCNYNSSDFVFCSALFNARYVNNKGNQIGSDGVISLASSLPYNISLNEINLSSNQIDDRGAYAMIEASCNPRCTLQSVEWDDNPDISAAAMVSLSRTQNVKQNRINWFDKLIQNLLEGRICSINLSKRKIGDEEVLHFVSSLKNNNRQDTQQPSLPLIQSMWLKGSLFTTRSLVPLFELCLPTPSNVMRLYLKDCDNAGDEQIMETIVKYLPDSKILQVLYMAGCSIETKGATFLAQALKKNTTLRRLNLDNNRIGDGGLIELASVLPHKALTALSVNQNNITDLSMNSAGLTHVEELHLNKNAITDWGMLDLSTNLKDGCLSWLSVLNNQVTERGALTVSSFMPETIPGSSIVEY